MLHAKEIKQIKMMVNAPLTAVPVNLSTATSALLRIRPQGGAEYSVVPTIVGTDPNANNHYCSYMLTPTTFPVTGRYNVQLFVTFPGSPAPVPQSDVTEWVVGPSL